MNCQAIVQSCRATKLDRGRSKNDSGSGTLGPIHRHLRVAQAHKLHVLCVLSPKRVIVSCFAPCLIHLYLLHSALRPLLLCFSLNTGPTPGLLFGRFAEQPPLTRYDPTLRSKWAVQSLRRHAYLQGKEVLDRGATLAEASLLPLLYRRWRIRFGNAGLTTVITGERQVRTHSEFITLIEKVLRRLLGTFVRGVQTREHQVETQNVVREPHSERERILPKHQDIRKFREMRAAQAVRGERVAQSKLSEAESHENTSWGTKKIIYSLKHDLSWDKQELRIESAERALHESGGPLHSQRMERYQANQLSDQCQRERSGYAPNWTEEKELPPSAHELSEFSTQKLFKKRCSRPTPIQKMKKSVFEYSH